MKRLILLMMALLLLTACSGQNEPGSSTVETTAPVPSGVYLPGSAIEQQTDGAVRVYDLTGSRVLTMDMGVAVLDEQGKLTLIDREEGEIQNILSGMEDLRAVSGNSVFYYDTDIHEYNLKTAQKNTWQLPAEVMGDFAVGTQTREIYYCTEGCIYALHMDTGLSRLLKQHSYTRQSILGAYFGGQVIGLETEEGISYLSAQNGLTLQKENNVHTLYSSTDMYLALRMDGIVEQKLFGRLDGQPQQLNVEPVALTPAFGQQGVVTVEVDQGLQLSFYDLHTGKKNAATVIAQEEQCLDLTADEQYVWILTETALYRWDVTKSATQDETVYTSAVWTAEAPDTVAMAQILQRVDQLQKAYGVKLHVGMDAVKNAQQHAMMPEHQIKAISKMLDELEPCLAEMPENFLKTTVNNGWIRVCLVRQVQAEAGYVRYWHDGDCYIAISLEADMREAFLSGIGGAVESNILGNSRDLEYWNDLNPKGFAYTYAKPVSEEYKEYVPAYFADAICMTYPTEDRARVFYHAMLKDNQELFAQEVMQKKLKLLCEGIREAYNLKKHTEILPWEQYLVESLAYVEE